MRRDERALPSPLAIIAATEQEASGQPGASRPTASFLVDALSATHCGYCLGIHSTKYPLCCPHGMRMFVAPTRQRPQASILP